MPKLFQACQGGDLAVACCMNAAGNGKECGPCPQCTYMVGSRRCKNTSCADSKYCHAHYKKVYGVQLMDTRFGKGLRAAKAFAKGDLICPMGGRRVTAASWLNNLPDDDTAPYGYTLEQDFTKFNVLVRDARDVEGYVPLSQPVPRRVKWRRLSSAAERDALSDMRMAYRKGNTVFLVTPEDYDAFITDAAQAVFQRSTPAERRKTPLPQIELILRVEAGATPLSGIMAPARFAAKLEVQPLRGPHRYDAACLRSVGSYANDGRDATGRSAGRPSNADITPVAPFPLKTGAWLVATADIPARQEILVDYGDSYWEGGEVAHGVKEVKKAPGQGGTVGVARADKGKQWIPAEGTKCPLRRVR